MFLMWNVEWGPSVLYVSLMGTRPVAMSLLKRERWNTAREVEGW